MNNDKNYTDIKLRQLVSDTNGRNPFLVPDGYFEAMPNRVMQRIAEEGSQATPRKFFRKSRLFIRLTAAAVIVGFFALAGINTYESHLASTQTTDMEILEYAQDLEYSDELLDYTMVDNIDIECYITMAE
jgi:hypothetical protein